MSEEQIRNTIVFRARSKYIPGTTMNISVALKLYLENDATEDEQIPLVVSRSNRPKNWVDAMGRPNCPECNELLFLSKQYSEWSCKKCGFTHPLTPKLCPECSTQMRILPVNISIATQIDKEYNSVWVCTNNACMETIYNTQTVPDILKELFNTGGK